MGKGSSGPSGPQEVIQTSSNIQEYARPVNEEMLGRTAYESTRPYEAYPGQRIADFDPYEQAGMQGMAEMAAAGAPVQMGMASDIASQIGYQPSNMGSQIAQGFDPRQVRSGYQAGAIDPGYQAGGLGQGYYAGQRRSGYRAGDFDPGYAAQERQSQFDMGPLTCDYQAGQFDPGYQAGQRQSQFEAAPSVSEYQAGQFDPGYVARELGQDYSARDLESQYTGQAQPGVDQF